MLRRREPTNPLRLRGMGCAVRAAYLLLEVVIATGLLVVALAIIGAQIQDSGTAIHRMQRRLEAVRLAEQQFAYLDLGLLELDSVDEVQEGDFGSRFPDWGWVIVTEPTAVAAIFRLRLEVLHHIREGDYREDTFAHDDAEIVYSAYAIRAAPRSVDFSLDFGMTDEETAEVAEKMQSAGVPFDPRAFNPGAVADWDIEQLIRSLPVLLKALGLELGDLAALIPPELLEKLKEEGLFGDPDEEESETP